MLKQEAGETKAHPTQVTTGRALDGRIEVNGSGLAVGDQIVVKGNETLQPGQIVRVIIGDQ